MEQKEEGIMMIIKNDNSNRDDCGAGGDHHHHHQSDEDEKGLKKKKGHYYLPIHSQVMKIKKEFEKIKHPSLSLQQPEMRRVLHGINRQRRLRSPLGLPDHRPFSVGVERNSCRV